MMFRCSTGLRSFAVPTTAHTRAAWRLLRGLLTFGRELRRPLANILRDGIYELRIRKGRVNYRILYFFHGRNLAILGHALTKEDKVPKADVERAIRRKRAFEADAAGHCYLEEEEK
jgi:phage-related protein